MKINRKLRRILSLAVLVALIVSTAVCLHIRRNDDALSFEPADHAAGGSDSSEKTFEILSEKRFKVTDGPVLSAVAPAERDETKKILAREMLFSQLISEVLDHRPDLIKKAEDVALAREPRILRLTQQKATENFSQTFIVSDSRLCADAFASLVEKRKIAVNVLFEQFCVDPVFDYPGGFTTTSPVEVEEVAWAALDQVEGLRTELDKLVRVELRNVVRDDFIAYHRTTGKLSYVQ